MAGEYLRCAASGKKFLITEEDRAFYERFGAPLPSLCPEERQRRRMAFRNDRHLYHRKCDATGKQILSLYPVESRFSIYCTDYFWCDRWDPLQYGRPVDFTRPFFEQFNELQEKVPRLALNSIANENCNYCSYVNWSRNCYLTFTADYNEDCYFGSYAYRNKDCVDFLFLFDCELCFECIDCRKCYDCQECQELEDCFDCLFCRDLIGCSNCCGCYGMRNKKYCLFNESLSKTAYFSALSELKLGEASGRERVRRRVGEFLGRLPRRARMVKNCEQVSGDYIYSSKNCHLCFDVSELEDCRYCSHLVQAKNCMDWDYYGDRAEMCYQMCSCAGNISFCMGCKQCWGGNSNLYYCDLCTASRSCFGCIGLKQGQCCILNKQYSENEYKRFSRKIIDHMKATGEWGEFFPMEISPHSYDESVAQDYFPLTEQEAQSQGLNWKGSAKTTGYFGPATEVPDSIAGTDESICAAVLSCKTSGAKYKIIQQELSFHRKIGAPLPQRCPAERHLDRMARRNPRVVRRHKCSKCGAELETSCTGTRGEAVYCEECYLAWLT